MYHAQTIRLLLWLVTLSLGAAQAQTFTVIHSFTGNQDGAQPYASLTLDSGNLYGTATAGGNRGQQTQCSLFGCGNVFKLTRHNSSWTLNPLYIFLGGSDGAAPAGPVSFGPGGLLYGTTFAGGMINSCNFSYAGCGVVFTLRPPATTCRSVLCPWTENVIYQFVDEEDGFAPEGSLAFDQAGNVYGTTAFGGSGGCGEGCGTVFQLTRSGSGWAKTTIADYMFGNGDPNALFGSLISDAAGNLYGTSYYGGAHNLGSVYEVTRSGSNWTTTVLHSFTDLATGAYAYGGLVMDSAGNLFGTAAKGGTGGGGIVFELSPANG